MAAGHANGSIDVTLNKLQRAPTCAVHAVALEIPSVETPGPVCVKRCVGTVCSSAVPRVGKVLRSAVFFPSRLRLEGAMRGARVGLTGASASNLSTCKEIQGFRVGCAEVLTLPKLSILAACYCRRRRRCARDSHP